MAAHVLRFGGQKIGDYVSHVVIEVARGREATIQSGLLRNEAIITDDGANLYYVLKTFVQYTASGRGMLDAAIWCARMGSLMRRGKQTVTVTAPDGDVLTLEEAAIRGPFSIPSRDDANTGLVRNLEVSFISEREPQLT